MKRLDALRLLCVAAAVSMLPLPAANADPDPDGKRPLPEMQQQSQTAKPPIEPPVTNPAKRDELLGQGWQGSADRLWTTSGDENGFHLLVADAKTGYSWRTAATLASPSAEADQWIGNACVTGSGKRAVVVYAPRTFTNKEQLFDRGGFTAVVDLDTGSVTHLPVRTTLAYYNPGCGVAETAALTQSGDEGFGKTGLLTVDTISSKLSKRIEVAGQITSAVPTRDGFVAAATGSLVRVDANGKSTRFAKAQSTPFQLRPDADGGVVFMDHDGQNSRIMRAEPGGTFSQPANMLATGKLGDVSIAAGTGGKLFITGKPNKVESLPAAVVKLDVPTDAVVSTKGEAVVTEVRPSESVGTAMAAGTQRQSVHIAATSTKTGKNLEFTVVPEKLAAPQEQTGIDVDRTCSVERNNPNLRVYQPKPKQVEWAVDMAVKGNLEIVRPPNWNNNDLPPYNPYELFKPVTLKNSLGQVPAQVMLGILGQESNLWQASRHVLPGETGNPLIGNFYGVDVYNKLPDGRPNEEDDWTIRWDKADCGYGVTQMTDGMRKEGKGKPNEVILPRVKQVAIATDYVANVMAGLQLLHTKWNELQDANVKINDNDSARLENWFGAIWAYNSGYHQPGKPDSNGAYGLGWGNNPANPKYKAGREPFGANPRDFATPQNWPYPEKVLGFAANPPSAPEKPGYQVPFFRAAWWPGVDDADAKRNRALVKPPSDLFCVPEKNNCHKDGKFVPDDPGPPGNPDGSVIGEPAGPCAHKSVRDKYDLKCWWHDSVTWKPDCAKTCGREFIRYDYPEYKKEQPNGESYPPNCTKKGLPVWASVIDNVTGVEPLRDPACKQVASRQAGNFEMSFGKDGNQPVAQIDLHQVGGGFGEHFWFGHTRNGGAGQIGDKMNITGTWTFDRKIQAASIYAYIPDHHANTEKAHYRVETATGWQTATISQKGNGNQWVRLGAFQFAKGKFPKVQLSTLSPLELSDGDESKIAFDALAIAPIAPEPGEPDEFRSRLIENVHSALCIALAGNPLDDGVAIKQSTCDDEAGFEQLWYLQDADDTTPTPYQIVNRNTGKCLEVRAGSKIDGAVVQQSTCDKTLKQQKWHVDPLGGKNGEHSKESIYNLNSDMCLAVAGARKDDGAPIVQTKCTAEAGTPADQAQSWNF